MYSQKTSMPIFSKAKPTKPFLCRASASAVLAVFSLCASGTAFANTCTYKYAQTDGDVEGSHVLVEQYIPVERQALGLVFMLHGSAGLYTAQPGIEPALDNFGEKTLARQCFRVVLPHYLQVLHRTSLTSSAEMIGNAPKLLHAASLLLTRAERDSPNSPVFLFGESLGGFITVSLSLERHEVRAVSETSGGYFGEVTTAPRNRHLAVLISHGSKDDLVPVAQAFRLRDYCRRFEKRVVLDIYPDVGHYFPPEQRLRCVERTGAFFRVSRKRQ